MPEQNEQVCDRCGQANVWNGRDRENVCAECKWTDVVEYERYQQLLDHEGNAA